jgi:pyruvate formate lyase activating enzyme
MLKIGGLQKMTLLDYPGKIAATIFLAGCNFRCPFCHNPDLVQIKEKGHYLETKDVLDFLKKRKDLLEAVCISGGEPLLDQDLPNFLKKVKELGYLIKLDTNGSNSAGLNKIIKSKLVDYIAMDIKGSLDKYQEITKTKFDLDNIKESIKIIRESGLPYEFRTTVLPKYHNVLEIEKISQLIPQADIYFLQNFRNKITLDPEFNKEGTFTEQELLNLKSIADQWVKKCEIRF